MSRMLNLVDHLLATGRKLHRLGRERDALRIFGRLAGFLELPPQAAEETLSRLAEIAFRHGHYRQARRHLKAALIQQPTNARYHHLMAAALSSDPKADLHRAADHYRRSLDLDPEQPRVLSEFGLVALRLGQAQEGLAALCRAVELAPNDPEIVSQLARGLCQADRSDEAQDVLRAAMFRNPRDGRFRDLWDHFQFQALCEAQAVRRRDVEARRREEEGPTILPFIRPEPSTDGAAGKRIRRDRPSPLRPPHLPRMAPLSDRKHA